MEEPGKAPRTPGRLPKLGWALLTCVAFIGAVEASMRLFKGAPPLPSGVARAQSLRLVEHEGRWVAERGVDGRLRSFPEPDGRPRVAILGGSSVMQDPIDGPQNFPVPLQRALPEVQILNLGTPGASSTGLAMLASELWVLELDAVVVYSGHNDFGNMLMGGELDTSARWQIQGQRLLAGSWIHAGLRALVLPKPLAVPQMSAAQDRLIFTQSAQAQSEQAATTERLVSNLRVLAQGVDLPVLWVPPISNLHHGPQGLRTGDGACMEVAQSMPRARPERPHQRAKELSQVCGEDTALGHWLLGHAALDRRQQEQALSHFEASLALDPTPLRAPMSARRAQVDLAQSLGHPIVDLWGEEPIWQPTDFVDTLHFSQAGAEKVAQALAPEVQALVSPRSEPQGRRR